MNKLLYVTQRLLKKLVTSDYFTMLLFLVAAGSVLLLTKYFVLQPQPQTISVIKAPLHSTFVATTSLTSTGKVLGLETNLNSISPASVAQSLPLSKEDIVKLIDLRINDLVASGLLKGEKGDKGDSAAIVSNNGGQSTAVVGGVPLVSYIPQNPSNGFVGGSLAGYNNLSSNSFSANNASVQNNLMVQGNTIISGSITATSFVGDGSHLTGIIGGSSQWVSSSSSSIYYNLGNVGIGTTSPDQALTVTGGIHVTGNLYDSSDSAGLAGMVLQATGNGTQWVATSTLGFTSSSSSATINGFSGPSFNFATSTTGSGILKITGSGSTITFALDTSSLQPAGSYIINSYASSTFPSFNYGSSTYATIINYPSYTYASSSFVTYGYGSSTYVTTGNLLNYPTYTYASSTYVNFNYSSSTFPSFAYATNTFATILTTPTFSYGSSTYINYGYGSSTFATIANYPTYSYASSTFVTSVLGSGSILSFGGLTPTIQLQNLTSNDILFGQGNNTIATSSNFTFSTTNGLTVNATSTLATTTATQLTLSRLTGTQCLHEINGVVSGTGSDCGVGGGSLSGGTKGYVASWASSTALTIGTLIDNGTVSGVNASSSTVSFNVQGSGALNPFNVASSSGGSLFMVTAGGNVGIGTNNPQDTLDIRGAVRIGDGNASAANTSLTIQNNNSTSGGLNFSLWNESTGTNSYSAIKTFANNGTVAGQIYADGLGTGPLGTPGEYIGTYTNHPVGLFTNNSERLIVTSGGSVGIGTNNPSSLFSVGASSQLQIDSSGNLVKINNVSYSWPSTQGASSSILTNDGAGNLSWGSAATGGLSQWQETTLGTTTTFNTNWTDIITTTAVTSGSNNVEVYVSGWAFESSAASQGTLFRILVDGVDTFDYDLLHVGNLGSEKNIAQSFRVTGLSAGSHTVKFQAKMNVQDTGVVNSGARLGVMEFASVAAGSAMSIGTQVSGASAGSVLFVNSSGYLSQDNNNFYWNATSTALGLGTTTPVARLSVTGTSALDPFNISSTSGISLLRVTQAGNVGIGTTTPRGALDVYGNAYFGYYTSGSASNALVAITANGNNGLITSVANTLGDPTSGISAGAVLGFNGSPTNFYGAGLGTARNSKYDIWFQTGAVNGGGYRWYTGTTENLTLTSGGNLGVGTTTPINKLHVYTTTNADGIALDGTSNPGYLFYNRGVQKAVIGLVTSSNAYSNGAAANDIALQTSGGAFHINTNSGSGNSVFMIQGGNGNVGIGTVSPNGKLEVDGNWSGNYGALTLKGDKPTIRYDSTQGAGSNVKWLTHIGSDPTGVGGEFEFFTGTDGSTWNSVMGLTAAGNVGIGVGSSNPGSRLSIMGSGAVDPFDISSTSGSTLLHVTQAGKIGIGTSTPSQLLSVVGNEQLTGALFDSTNASGTSGMVLQSTGTGTQWVATSTLGFISSGGSGSGISILGSSSTTLVSSIPQNGSAKIAAVTVTVPAGSKVLVEGNLSLSNNGVNSPTGADTQMWLARGGTQIALTKSVGTGLWTFNHSQAWVDDPGPGTYEYEVYGAETTNRTSPTVFAAHIQVVAIGNSSSAWQSNSANLYYLPGNVSIGTTSSSSLLTLQGTSSFASILSIASSTGNNILTVSNTGNVGIGTSSPASLLQVAGDIQLGSKGLAVPASLIFNTGSTTNQSTIRLLATTSLASSYNLTLPTTTPVAGQVLTTDANGNLYWSTPSSTSNNASSSGGLVLLEQHTANNSSELDFTTCLASGYDDYMISAVSLIPTTNAVGTKIELSTNGGISYANSGYSNAGSYVYASGNGLANQSTTTFIPLHGANDYNGSTGGYSGKIYLSNVSSSSVYKTFTEEGVGFDTTISNTMIGLYNTGSFNSSTPVNAFRVLATSGNLNSGVVRCYGLSSSAGSVSGGGTVTYGSSSLASNYTVPGASFTDTGLSVTLPAAGTYLVQVNARVINGSGSTYAVLRLKNTTDGVVIPNTNTIGNYPTSGFNSISSISAMVTTSGANKVISLQAEAPVNGSPSLAADSSGDGGSYMTYLRIDNLGSGASSQWVTSPNNSNDIYDSTGNVGIGSTSPNALLTVVGKAGATTPELIIATSTGATHLIVTSAGSVGIGTSSPATTLALQGTAGTDILDIASSNGSSLFHITQAGKIGIGTSTPSASLQLQSSPGITPLIISSSSGSTLLSVDQTGKLTVPNLTVSGINGATQCLHVDSSGNLTGTGSDCGAGGGGGSGGGQLMGVYATSTAGTGTIQFTGLSNSSPSYSNGVVTLPSNTSYVVIEMWGAGGGGDGGAGFSNCSSGGAGGNGGTSTLSTGGVVIATSTGGGGGGHINCYMTGGSGGSGFGGDINLTGQGGNAGQQDATYVVGGHGGSAPRGGGGGYSGDSGTAGQNGANFGGGGGGGSCNSNGSCNAGGGGAGGGYISKLITSLSTYSFTIGAGGAAGAAGGNGTNGGAGGDGGMVIYVYTTGASNGIIGSASTAGQLAYYSATGTSISATSEVFISGTNVGIGTTAPTSGLFVQGTNGTSPFVVASSTGTQLVTVTQAGFFGIGTSSPNHLITLSGGAYSDGSSWNNASDVNLKENFASVTPADILQKIITLPISQWNYKSEPADVTHLGPTAQDFYGAFHLGNSSTSISTIDEPAVALLGIQALNDKIAALQGELSNYASSTLTVSQPVNYTPILTVINGIYFSGDNLGQAKILTGATTVRVSFIQQYQYQPIVVATPLDFIDGSFRVTNVDATGFTIELKTSQTTDVTFNWHSWASADAKLSVSDGSIQGIQLVVNSSPAQSTNTPAITIIPVIDNSTTSSTPSTTPDSEQVLGTSTSTPDSTSTESIAPVTDSSVNSSSSTDPLQTVPQPTTSDQTITPDTTTVNSDPTPQPPSVISPDSSSSDTPGQ